MSPPFPARGFGLGVTDHPAREALAGAANTPIRSTGTNSNTDLFIAIPSRLKRRPAAASPLHHNLTKSSHPTGEAPPGKAAMGEITRLCRVPACPYSAHSTQITRVCADHERHHSAPSAAPNGGSARGYQELRAPLAIPATAEQAVARPVCLCIASSGRDRPLLPRWGSGCRMLPTSLWPAPGRSDGIAGSPEGQARGRRCPRGWAGPPYR